MQSKAPEGPTIPEGQALLQLSENEMWMFGFKTKTPEASTSLKLSDRERWLLGTITLVSIGDFGPFSSSEKGGIKDRYSLTSAIVDLETFIRRLRSMKLALDVPMGELNGYSLKQLAEVGQLMAKERDKRISELDPSERPSEADLTGGKMDFENQPDKPSKVREIRNTLRRLTGW